MRSRPYGLFVNGEPMLLDSQGAIRSWQLDEWSPKTGSGYRQEYTSELLRTGNVRVSCPGLGRQWSVKTNSRCRCTCWNYQEEYACAHCAIADAHLGSME